MSILPTSRPSKHAVTGLIEKAAHATGVDFSYLLATAKRESGLNPNARAKTSSAEGLFQFIDQTWLATLKSAGARHGYGAYANAISRRPDGRYRVDEAMQQAVMGLKFDPTANAKMAGELTRAHATYLQGKLGREVSQGELYVAHFLGPEGANRLISSAQQTPHLAASSLFPAQAKANRAIFYDNGRPLSLLAVYQNLTRGKNEAYRQEPKIEASDAPLVRDPNRLNEERYSQEQLLFSLLYSQEDEAGAPSDFTRAFGEAYGRQDL